MNNLTKTIFTTLLSISISNPAISVNQSDIKQAVDAVKTLDFGQSAKSHRDINRYINETHNNPDMRLYLEQQIAEALRDDGTTLAATKFFCRKLAVIGTDASIPALSELLKDENTVEYACFALKNNPFPNVNDALILALESLPGKSKVPVIHLLGERHSENPTQTLKAISEFIQHNNKEVVTASISALGNLGTPDCMALLSAIRKVKLSEYEFELSNAYLQCALQLIKDNKIDQAVKILTELHDENEPNVIQRGARHNLLDLGRLDINFDAIEPVQLFDGKTFEGWNGNLDFFRIENGAIVGGNLNEKIPRNEFLTTEKEFRNFELRLQVKLSSKDANAGIQIRSRRIPNHNEMIGYQADMGQHYWGALYDESRRRKVLAGPKVEDFPKFLKPTDWNDYTIRCTGRRIQLWINGYQTVDYLEPDESLSQTGLIGLQIHSGPPSEARYRNIEIRVLDEANIQ